MPDYTPFPAPLEQVRDAAGTLWLSNGAATPTWRRASTFEIFGNLRRVYGPGTTLPPAGFKGDPAASALHIDATKQILTPPFNGSPSGVPAGAIAAWCAVQAYEPGAISIYPDNLADPGAASWASAGTTGKLQMLYMMVPLSPAGKFSITNYFTTKHIYIDVWGFLSASA